MNFNVQPWQASTAYTVGQVILDPNLNIQVVRTVGTSKAGAAPDLERDHQRQHN